ncbi:ParB N-terminal domain-containing protein [bacterium]|nr:ParB N-terminal domain-containing protein [bacterium]
MKLEYQMQRLNLTDIDPDNRDFDLSYNPDLTPLARSIKSVGLVYPLIVHDELTNKVIVDGWRRFRVLKEHSIRAFSALVLTRQSRLNLLDIYLAVNSFHRQFNLIEASMIFHKMKSKYGLDDHYIIAHYLKYVNINLSPESYLKILELSHLIDELKKGVALERINLSNAYGLAQLDEGKQSLIAEILRDLQFNTNKLSQLLLYLEEIGNRDETEMEIILDKLGLKTILENSKINSNEKIELILDGLEELRYPHYSRLKARVKALRKALKLPPQINLVTPSSFDGNSFKFELNFNEDEQCRRLVDELRKAIQSTEFERIIELF